MDHKYRVPFIGGDDVFTGFGSLNYRVKKLAKGKTQADAPTLAEELLKVLPDQGRNELKTMLEYNLRSKYLPQEKKVTK